MRAMTTLAVLAAALAAAGAASAAPSVKIKDAVARVVVIPENRPDVKVEVIRDNASLPLTVRQNGDEIIVDGDLRHNRISSCNSRDGKITVHVRGVGDVDYDAMPQIAIRAPMNVKVAGGGAVFGDIGRSASVELDNAGCGTWTVANTAGAMKINQAGSGDTRAGSAGSLEVNIAGSGNVVTRAVAGDLEAAIAGSGDVRVASIGGRLKGNIVGSGNVTVAGGHARSVSANVMGSGNVTFDGDADAANVTVAGSGNIRIARVNGPVQKHVAGSGDVIIGR
ncbi:DUF2807 domain-containing protein [Caulobacter sp. SSI4214]|uniref:GIN domain-containing protein n=1 Tax=Caulobacter sp. SSI4214 TaxID=2575739 RepID=UPI00143C6790|nr:DUF2807 domain-containing protein [Caulobacter sp. SSI4214]